MVAVPLASLTPEELRLRKTELTLTPGGKGSFGGADGKTEIRLYGQDADYLYVPRKYGLGNMELAGRPSVDERSDGPTVEMSFHGSLRPSQEKPVAEVLRTLESAPWTGSILEAPCGSGKTTLALYVAAQLKRPALIIVHTEVLLAQWVERIKQFLQLPDNKIGRIQQDRCDYEGCPITVGMIHSIAEKDYPTETYSHFGFVVFDEVHRVGAPVFSKAVPKFNARYVLGLSATPERYDGMEKVFLWHIGNIIRSDQTWEIKPKVYQIQWMSRVHPSAIKVYGKNEVSLGKLATKLGQDARRNIWLAGEIAKAAKAGRKILVLSDRIEHLKRMRELLQAQTRNTTITSGFVIGGMKEDKRLQSTGCNVMFGTFGYVSEGFDVAELDTLYLTSPHVNIEQSVGRILRRHPSKKEPVVVDVVDSLPITRAFGGKRLAFYEQNGFEVTQVLLGGA